MEYQLVEDGLATSGEVASLPNGSPERPSRGHTVPAGQGYGRTSFSSGHSPDEVYHAIGDRLTQLGRWWAILAVDEERRTISVVHLDLDSVALRTAEQLTGASSRGYCFSLIAGGFYEDIISADKAVFTDCCLEPIAEALPKVNPALVSQLQEVLGVERAVFAPLGAGGAVTGLLVVAGPDLSHSDVPAVAAVASQASSVLETAQASRAARYDLGDRNQTERELTAAIREKEALLKEIHHRVKNNLQVVSSLLSLQAMRAGDPESVAAFRDSQGRVRSMALIHESLYQSWNVAEVDFAEYVPRLVEALLQVYGSPARRITWGIDVSDVSLAIDLATPCALILNELVSNCLKHAFPGDRSGQVRITFHKESDGRYVLVVSDDGAGLPPNVDIRSAGTLGLQLVRMLAQQLSGSVEAVSGDGTTVRVGFLPI